MSGNSHDRTRAVLQQHEIAYPNGNLRIVERIDRVASSKEALFFRRCQVFGLHGHSADLRKLRFGFRTPRRIL